MEAIITWIVVDPKSLTCGSQPLVPSRRAEAVMGFCADELQAVRLKAQALSCWTQHSCPGRKSSHRVGLCYHSGGAAFSAAWFLTYECH